MRILVISQYFYPENFRINDIVKELVKKGHVVTVLTGLPNYPEGRIYQGYKNAFRNIENYYGALVYRCKLRPRKNGSLNLALNYISFIRQAKKTLKHIKPDFDVIYFYEPSPISSGIPAVWYGKKHNIKTAIYNLDIWPDCVRETQNGKVMSKKNPIFLISKAISRYVYKRFDLIINKCDEFSDYLTKTFHIEETKMATLYEHAEDVYLAVHEIPIDNGVVDFMFLGNIGKSQNCNQIVYAFSRIKNEKAHLHFVGDGSYMTKLQQLVNELGLNDKVSFYGKVPIEDTIEFYNYADACLLSLSSRTISGLTPPAKLTSYMAASRCVIASIEGAAKRIVEESKCGLVCPPNNIDRLSEIMQRIIDDQASAVKCGKNGREYFLQNFTIEGYIDSLEQLLQGLLTK